MQELPPVIFRTIAKPALIALTALCLPLPLAAQSTEDVKSDVLSALATPLPITVIGPLLTRDVLVAEEEEGFRATLQDTSLMGLFPIGDVSMKLVVVDGDTYQVSDLQFPNALDFPGLAQISFDAMTLDGTWSTTDRSYSVLEAALTGLDVLPGDGNQGALSLGQLAFDVEKEPDETDTESRFDITLDEISATGLGGPDVTVGGAHMRLSANGEQPVDLYSLLRELILAAGMRDGGVSLLTLGESLLGNSYGTVAIDLEARGLDIVDPQEPDERYFRATEMQAELAMRDVSARDWGDMVLSFALDEVSQQSLADDGTFEVERARMELSAAELPVADLFSAIDTLETAHRGPVRVSDLLDGFMEFGALAFSTEGDGLSIQMMDRRMIDGEWQNDTAFVAGFDSWGAMIALEDFNRNIGAVSSYVDFRGGVFTPGARFPKEDLRHVTAWFPKVLSYGAEVSNLNEGFLKRLFADVLIEDIDEPVEILLPLALYVAASVVDVASEDNLYETGLFTLEQSGTYRVYPAKLMSLAPFEGEVITRLAGFDDLLTYFEELYREDAGEGHGSEELSILKSAFTVLRNLGEVDENGQVTWIVEKPDVNQGSITVNGTTLYYPELGQFLPFAFLGSAL